ncbi:MAG: hypothetical protein AAGJ54_05865 [Planctomycetota bacterium]
MARAFAPSTSSPLIICDGGVESVLAAAHAAEAYSASGPEETATPVLWSAPPREVGDSAGLETTERIARTLALRTVQAPVPRAIKAGDEVAPEADTLMLVRACSLAAEMRLRRVVWPIRHNHFDDSARAFDRATLVGRLASLDAEAAGLPEITVETPYVDLADDQIADLIQDISAPVEACWWLHGAAATTEAGLDEHRRWRSLVEGVGVVGVVSGGGEQAPASRATTVKVTNGGQVGF